MKLKQLIELNFKEGEKVNISPIGEVTGIDGRTYKIDAAAVIAATKANGIDLVLDVNHGYSEHGESAAGWFDVNSLEERSDGIYASLNTTEMGDEKISKRLFRYLSPAYIMDRNKADRTVLAIDSVGLVNRPNLLKESLNHQNKEDDNMTAEEIAAMQAENRRLQEEMNTQKALNTEMSGKVAELNAKFREQKIDTAIKAGELMPNKKEFALTLEENSLNQFLELNKADAEHLKKDTHQSTEQKKQLTDAEREVNRQLGLEENR